MSEQIVNNQTELPAHDPLQPTDTQPEKAVKVYTEDQVQEIIKQRLEREKAKRETEAKTAKEKAEADALAKNQEWQKLAESRNAELEKLKAELEAAKKLELKRGIAAKFGLPEALIPRLQGDTAEDIEADAKTLFEILPKGPKTPTLNPTNPAGASTGESDAQRLARIHGQAVDILDPTFAREHGGGVVWVDKEGK